MFNACFASFQTSISESYPRQLHGLTVHPERAQSVTFLVAGMHAQPAQIIRISGIAHAPTWKDIQVAMSFKISFVAIQDGRQKTLVTSADETAKYMTPVLDISQVNYFKFHVGSCALKYVYIWPGFCRFLLREIINCCENFNWSSNLFSRTCA